MRRILGIATLCIDFKREDNRCVRHFGRVLRLGRPMSQRGERIRPLPGRLPLSFLGVYWGSVRRGSSIGRVSAEMRNAMEKTELGEQAVEFILDALHR